MTLQASAALSQSAALPWARRPRLAGWVLLGCWVLLILAPVVFGERASSLSALRSGVADRDVRVVHVAGGLPADEGSTGYSHLELHWRDGLVGHHAEIVEARPLGAAPDGNLLVVRAGEVDRLVASQPGLRIVHVGYSAGHEMESTAFGWQIPNWLFWAGLAVMVATLGLLIAGPQPWRATRWAWFWVFGIPAPIGVLAYLVLAGPTALSRTPRPGAARLTGGWAFLFSIFVSSLFGAAFNWIG